MPANRLLYFADCSPFFEQVSLKRLNAVFNWRQIGHDKGRHLERVVRKFQTRHIRPGVFATCKCIATALSVSLLKYFAYVYTVCRKNSNDFDGIQYSVKYESPHGSPVVTSDNYKVALTQIT